VVEEGTKAGAPYTCVNGGAACLAASFDRPAIHMCAIHMCAIHMCAIHIGAIHMCAIHMCAIHMCEQGGSVFHGVLSSACFAAAVEQKLKRVKAGPTRAAQNALQTAHDAHIARRTNGNS